MWCERCAAQAAAADAGSAALLGSRPPTVRSQADLLRRIYTTEAPANACVRLLNATGEVGCAGAPPLKASASQGNASAWCRVHSGCPSCHAILRFPSVLLPSVHLLQTMPTTAKLLPDVTVRHARERDATLRAAMPWLLLCRRFQMHLPLHGTTQSSPANHVEVGVLPWLRLKPQARM